MAEWFMMSIEMTEFATKSGKQYKRILKKN